MPKRIYVGNLPFSATDDEVRELFEEYGTVNEVKLITDRETGRPRGFGFVEMAEDVDLDTVIKALDSYEFNGRKLRVNESHKK
ncbi:MAG: RNA-binding protein [Bacteroidota bacterium]